MTSARLQAWPAAGGDRRTLPTSRNERVPASEAAFERSRHFCSAGAVGSADGSAAFLSPLARAFKPSGWLAFCLRGGSRYRKPLFGLALS